LTAVEDGQDAVKVEASTDAVKFIRDNDSFDFNVAVDIAHASFWEIVLHHFPHRYVDALWDGWALPLEVTEVSEAPEAFGRDRGGSGKPPCIIAAAFVVTVAHSNAIVSFVRHATQHLGVVQFINVPRAKTDREVTSTSRRR